MIKVKWRQRILGGDQRGSGWVGEMSSKWREIGTKQSYEKSCVLFAAE